MPLEGKTQSKNYLPSIVFFETLEPRQRPNLPSTQVSLLDLQLLCSSTSTPTTSTMQQLTASGSNLQHQAAATLGRLRSPKLGHETERE